MEKVATDIYTFSHLRDMGFTYVDKTDALFQMASGEVGKQFFIDALAAKSPDRLMVPLVDEYDKPRLQGCML